MRFWQVTIVPFSPMVRRVQERRASHFKISLVVGPDTDILYRYTMQGDLDLSPLSAPKSEAGIVPRVLHRLFSLLESAVNTEYTVRCSYVELYNEELRDLLSAEYNPVAAGDKQPMAMAGNSHGQQVGGLKLYEDGKKGVMIQGLEETGVRTLQEALGIVNKGCMRRQVAETKMNTESS